LTDDNSHRLDRPPFEFFIPALEKRKKGVHDLPGGKAAYLLKGPVRIASIQEIEKFCLETAAAILQCKGPYARERNFRLASKGTLNSEVRRFKDMARPKRKVPREGKARVLSEKEP
jgi:hypothetical protein